MENIEIGEYIRVNQDFRTICIGIGKVVNKNQDTIYVSMSNNNLPISFNVKRIVKHSKQLIDLIEDGDLCYYKVSGSDTIHKNLATVNSLRKIQLYFYSLEQIEIIKILTHEQIEANCYKVGVGGEDE